MYVRFRHIKIKKSYVYFIIKIFLVENECKTPIGYLTFIFYQKYFYDKTDLRLFYFHVAIYTLCPGDKRCACLEAFVKHFICVLKSLDLNNFR